MSSENLLPRRPFFTCEETAFSIVDAEAMRRGITQGPITPVFTLRVASGNIFENRPRRVTTQQGLIVTVECDGDTTVILDFDEESALAKTTKGEFRYLGGIDEGNDAKGFIRAS
jgi:hypothetical protein